MLNCWSINAAPSELLSGKGESYKFERAQNSTLYSPNSTLSKLHTRNYTINYKGEIPCDWTNI